MLEHSPLILSPWSQGRLIIASQGGPGGFAIWSRPRGPRWLRWLRRPALEVHESDDEPLLLTMHPGWGNRWDVREAENSLVGYLHGPLLLDSLGDELAVFRWSPPAGKGLFTHRHRGALALLERRDAGLCLEFSPQAASPFERMVLLAAAVAHTLT
jgi:hypothetical protein